MKLTLILLVMALVPSMAWSQERPDSVKLRNDCRLAEQVLRTGHPAPKAEWAVWQIRRCDGAGSLLADVALNRRFSTDTAELNRATSAAVEVRDRRIYDAALTILTDPSASPQARVFAVRSLMWLFQPGAMIEYGHLVDTDGDGDRACFGSGPGTHASIVRGELLPSGWPERIREEARMIAERTDTPFAVRQAATCLLLVRPHPILQRMGVSDAT